MTKTDKKIIWLWIALAFAILLSVATITTALLLTRQPQQAPAPETEPTTETTPTTLPPPVANTLGPEDFIYENGYLTCTAAESRLGIDVSKHQGVIDWQAVKNAGITFAIIRVAGRGYGEAGALYTDEYALRNYRGAKAVGIDVGVYFFSQAITAEEAREEARYTLRVIDGWDLDMPVVYDWEVIENDVARTDGLDPRIVTDCMLAFCDEIEKAGRTPMVYFNPVNVQQTFYIEEVTQYKFWLAFYTDWMTFPYEVNMWQYTCTGSVPGISGKVDLNLLFPESIKG